MTHKVKVAIYNIDTGEDEIVECEISDDLYKIITNGIGKDFSLPKPRPLRCTNFPTDVQAKKASKRFGEGFTWTCGECAEQYVLQQGKGDRWYWDRVKLHD